MVRYFLPNNNEKCYRNFSQKFLDLNTPNIYNLYSIMPVWNIEREKKSVLILILVSMFAYLILNSKPGLLICFP
jgi:hypothetical protein